jgi:hypothetical protein
MSPIDKELQNEIRKGVTLQKVDESEMKKREEEKKKRMEELNKIKEALGEQ